MSNEKNDDLAITPDLMDNRVIGHRKVEPTEGNDQETLDTNNTEVLEDTTDSQEVSTGQQKLASSRLKNSKTLPEPVSEYEDELEQDSESSSEELTTMQTTTETTQSSQQPFFERFKMWVQKHKVVLGGVGIGLLLLLITLGGVGAYSYTVSMQLKDQAQAAEFHARTALDQFKAQNLPATEVALADLKQSVTEIDTTYKKLAFAGFVPFANNYYADGTNGLIAAQAGVDAGIKAVTAITPYADVLGFVAEDEEEDPATATAENRVKLLLETLTIIMPTLDEINGDLTIASDALNKINPERYPESFGDIEVRAQLVAARETLDNAQTVLEDYRPIIEHLPAIAGSNVRSSQADTESAEINEEDAAVEVEEDTEAEPAQAEGGRKKYLVLFQNDNELRPTGGFLTAYSVIFVEDGVVTPEKSDDIYELDQRFNEQIPIPEALGRYLTTERYFNLRDMNISPDFKTSMDLFFENYQLVRGEPDNIDGIITVDTHVLTRLLETVGPVEIPGYGTFSAENDPRCDCPQIIYALSEIITRPTPYLREDRKGILAPLMQALLTKVYQSPRTFMADLFEIGLESIEGRHVQTYFLNEDHQLAAEKINAAGELKSQTPEGDFIAIVNANLGGAKSNLFVDYSVEQTVDGPVDGRITKNVEITYKNPRKADNCNLEAGLLCLNSTLRDWTRIYLPEGSELISAQGFTTEPQEYVETYEGTNYEVIDGFFILEPMGLARLRLEYTVPYDSAANDDEYALTIWKQGGTNPIEHLIDVNGGQELFTAGGDTVVRMPF
jgi:hypothetical protein